MPGTPRRIQKMFAEFRSPACLQGSEWDWHYYHHNNTRPFKGEGSGKSDVGVNGEALSCPAGMLSKGKQRLWKPKFILIIKLDNGI